MLPSHNNWSKPLAVLAGISLEQGWEQVHYRDRSFDSEAFCAYLEDLSAANPGIRLAVFMDNLAVHKTKQARELMDSLGIRPIYNAPYSPNGNPIERVFGLLKQAFRKLRLQDDRTQTLEDKRRQVLAAVQLVSLLIIK